MSDIPGAVLFCCTRNSVRSPMAEGLLKFLHGHRTYVDSAGVREGEIDGFVVTVMDEVGVDMARHRSKTFEEMEDAYFDLVISLSPEAHHSAMELTRTMACDVEFWNTFDPALIESESRDVKLESYRQVRDQLTQRIKARFPTHAALDT